MQDTVFKAMVVEEISDGSFTRAIVSRSLSALPIDDVIIKVHYSSLNYKDALSASGNKGVTRRYPHTPGIDAAGTVHQSQGSRFSKGDRVLVTGYDLGMNTPGGFGQFISVPEDWVVPLPEPLTLKESMSLGTAGFTAALCVDKLERGGIKTDNGCILVTGASGGVGTIAVALLSRLGYSVVAATGKTDVADMLKSLGAETTVTREEVLDASGKALLPQRWAAVIDTVGGNTLSSAIRSTARHGVIACCGNASSADLPLTVYPFILRGVSLMGADSATSTMETRNRIWGLLSTRWKIDCLDQITTEIELPDLNDRIDAMLSGRHTGRSLIRLGD